MRGASSGSATVTRSPDTVRVETRRTTAPLIVTSPFAIHVCTRVRVALRTSIR